MLLRRAFVAREFGRKAGLADFGTSGLDVLAGVESFGTGRDDLRVECEVDGGGLGRNEGVDTVRLVGEGMVFAEAGVMGDLVDARRKFVCGVTGAFA